jgi:hypothetical protein
MKIAFTKYFIADFDDSFIMKEYDDEWELIKESKPDNLEWEKEKFIMDKIYVLGLYDSLGLTNIQELDWDLEIL